MFGLVFFFTGLGAFFLAYALLKQSQYFTNDVIKVQGRVVEIRKRRYKNSTVHRPVIEYMFQGQTWQHEAEYDLHINRQQIGSFCTMIFNPLRPSMVCAEFDIHGRSLIMLICFGLSIPFMILGLYLAIDSFSILQSGGGGFTSEMFSNAFGLFVLIVITWKLKPILQRIKSDKKYTVWGLSDNAERIDKQDDQTKFG
ncbi:hypothetical protein A3K93_08400 [Acinetobacter sp. NCu2D-2]|uniref:DUF3592 domain-containing protein n=1 Tax=Acinetobacter sp. NCu2D-2 TaxID=1608473 RepID=UPI0007CDF9DB|nr:DUF3592 domain-containing protein [Acinetobacter sp. NCu2D-2]ANF82215.1 hypothetical protein A3K93_08400 [Acinetobacter sp. NCu2D-2]